MGKETVSPALWFVPDELLAYDWLVQAQFFSKDFCWAVQILDKLLVSCEEMSLLHLLGLRGRTWTCV